jgi:hypothetical protein
LNAVQRNSAADKGKSARWWRWLTQKDRQGPDLRLPPERPKWKWLSQRGLMNADLHDREDVVSAGQQMARVGRSLNMEQEKD